MRRQAKKFFGGAARSTWRGVIPAENQRRTIDATWGLFALFDRMPPWPIPLSTWTKPVPKQPLPTQGGN
jgi:hypothetical protein